MSSVCAWISIVLRLGPAVLVAFARITFRAQRCARRKGTARCELHWYADWRDWQTVHPVWRALHNVARKGGGGCGRGSAAGEMDGTVSRRPGRAAKRTRARPQTAVARHAAQTLFAHPPKRYPSPRPPRPPIGEPGAGRAPAWTPAADVQTRGTRADTHTRPSTAVNGRRGTRHRAQQVHGTTYAAETPDQVSTA